MFVTIKIEEVRSETPSEKNVKISLRDFECSSENFIESTAK